MKKNILFAGLYHETHTFLPRTTTREDFTFTEGKSVFSMRGDRSPVDGFLEAADKHDWNVIPLLDARAMPSGMVEDEVFEAYWDAFKRNLAHVRGTPIDAIFLVLHGAMATRSFPDVEGELLRRIRDFHELKELPLFAVIDLHANVSEEMTRHTNALVAYKKNPHTDARETAVRAAEFLRRTLQTRRVPSMDFVAASMLLSPLATGTDGNFMGWLVRFAELLKSHHPDVWEINVTPGFSYADTPSSGLSFSIMHEGNRSEAENLLLELKKEAWRLRNETILQHPPADEVMKDFSPDPSGPVIFVESSDNIGAGTSGDATGALRALIDNGVTNAAVVINDPESVQSLQNATEGESVSIDLGGIYNPFDQGPLPLEAKLIRRTDGKFTLENSNSHLASMNGIHINMGPCAVVECQGVEILITSRPTPPFDLGQLRSQGIEPETKSAIVVKAAVGHKQAYDPIASRTEFIDTPGPCPIDVKALPFKHLKHPIFPLSQNPTLNPIPS